MVIFPYHFCHTVKHMRHTSEIDRIKINNIYDACQAFTIWGDIANKEYTLSYIIPSGYRIPIASSFAILLLLHYSRTSQCKRIGAEYYLLNKPMITFAKKPTFSVGSLIDGNQNWTIINFISSVLFHGRWLEHTFS